MPEWLWSIVVGIVVMGLVAALRASDQRRLDEKISAILDQVGRDSQSGMRKVIHDTANSVSSGMLAIKLIELMDERVKRLERIVNHRGRDG